MPLSQQIGEHWEPGLNENIKIVFRHSKHRCIPFLKYKTQMHHNFENPKTHFPQPCAQQSLITLISNTCASAFLLACFQLFLWVRHLCVGGAVVLYYRMWGVEKFGTHLCRSQSIQIASSTLLLFAFKDIPHCLHLQWHCSIKTCKYSLQLMALTRLQWFTGYYWTEVHCSVLPWTTCGWNTCKPSSTRCWKHELLYDMCATCNCFIISCFGLRIWLIYNSGCNHQPWHWVQQLC